MIGVAEGSDGVSLPPSLYYVYAVLLQREDHFCLRKEDEISCYGCYLEKEKYYQDECSCSVESDCSSSSLPPVCVYHCFRREEKSSRFCLRKEDKRSYYVAVIQSRSITKVQLQYRKRPCLLHPSFPSLSLPPVCMQHCLGRKENQVVAALGYKRWRKRGVTGGQAMVRNLYKTCIAMMACEE